MNACTFNKGGKCSILGEKNCEGCSFIKTDKQLEEGRAKAKERIDSLPAEAKKSIMDKYYHREAVRKGRSV
jgi:hypothetical protein